MAGRHLHAKSKAFPLTQLDPAAEHYDDYLMRLEKGVGRRDRVRPGRHARTR